MVPALRSGAPRATTAARARRPGRRELRRTGRGGTARLPLRAGRTSPTPAGTRCPDPRRKARAAAGRRTSRCSGCRGSRWARGRAAVLRDATPQPGHCAALGPVHLEFEQLAAVDAQHILHAPATSSTAASPVQRENSRPGAPGWEIPASAGTVITGPGHQTGLAGVAHVNSYLQSLAATDPPAIGAHLQAS